MSEIRFVHPINQTGGDMRIALLVVLLIGSAIPSLTQAQEVSPFHGVWAGKLRYMAFFSTNMEMELTVAGREIRGVYQDDKNQGLVPIGGVVSTDGKTATFRLLIPGGMTGKMEIVDINTMKFSSEVSKANLKRQDQAFVRQPPYIPRDNSDLVAINQMASDLNRQATAMRAGSSASHSSTGMSMGASGSSNACNGYPLEARGDHPPGRVCRCVIGGPNQKVGWWAVVPGNESTGSVVCGPPRDSSAAVAYTAQDEDRAHLEKVNAWNAEQQRQRELQAAADRERALQQQLVDQQAQIARMRQQQEQQRQQRNQQSQGQGSQSGSSSGQSNLPTHSPNQCFSDRTAIEGDVSVVYLTNRCSHRVYWHVCINKANAPWNDHYPGFTDPGGQSSIRLWQPGEKTSATYRYNTSFDGSQTQPSC